MIFSLGFMNPRVLRGRSLSSSATGDGMVHAKGTATDWATILVTQGLPAG